MSELTRIPSRGAPSLPNLAPNAPILAPTTSPLAQKIADEGGDKSFPLDELLNIGTQVVGAIGQARGASGKAANRQARIAACGRKPLWKKNRKAYDECIAAASSGGGGGENENIPAETSLNKMKVVWIGLGIIALGGLAYYLLKEK